MQDRERHSSKAGTVLAWPAPSAKQLNPYISLVYGGFAQAGLTVKPFQPMHPGPQTGDIFHVHWPEAILWGRLAGGLPGMTKFAATRVIRTMDNVRARGGVVAWTVHNLAPHAVGPRQRAVWNAFFPAFRARVDLLIGMTESSLDIADAAYPDLRGRPRAIVPHPHFRASYPPPRERTSARASFGLPADAFVVGMLGTVRASKGVPRVIAAFHAMQASGKEPGKEMLLVAGECTSESERRLIGQAHAGDSAVVFANAALSPARLSEAFAAVDAVLINQQTTLNSGTLLLALSMNRPVIAPACGSVSELAGQLGGAWIETFSGELSASRLRSLLDSLKDRPRPALAPLEAFDPARVSEATVRALTDAFARQRQPHFTLQGQGGSHDETRAAVAARRAAG
jgi:glycosyltransferase involved in cell wall biosynthesis